ncbi:MAG TPA: DUF4395 domain-containing protein [Acidimicrobiales bacterium]|nr:MAG: hypothetical protein B7X07_04055 [Actinobacteria bacterium 21-64-8]HQT99521.1 DUF4395 domain-containing protein [Acidimicrobiales bacterium]
MKAFFSFPNPVDDAAARSVALGVVTLCVVTFVSGWAWLLVPLTYGFAARVAAGPKISPLGRLAVHVTAPRLVRWQRFVAGPPKRFAQAIGLAFSFTTLILWLSVGWLDARWVLLPLAAAASLEGFFGFCLGCAMFSGLMRLGVIPESVCLECADLSSRYATAGATLTAESS